MEEGERAYEGQMFSRRFISRVLWMGWGCGLEPKPEIEMPFSRKKEVAAGGMR